MTTPPDQARPRPGEPVRASVTADDTPESAAARQRWTNVLQAFPFLFLPIVAAIGIVCSVVVPWWNGFTVR